MNQQQQQQQIQLERVGPNQYRFTIRGSLDDIFDGLVFYGDSVMEYRRQSVRRQRFYDAFGAMRIQQEDMPEVADGVEFRTPPGQRTMARTPGAPLRRRIFRAPVSPRSDVFDDLEEMETDGDEEMNGSGTKEDPIVINK